MDQKSAKVVLQYGKSYYLLVFISIVFIIGIIILIKRYKKISKKQINLNNNQEINLSTPICINDNCDTGRTIPTCGGYINPKSGCCGGSNLEETCCDRSYKLYNQCKEHNACLNKRCS